MTISLLFAGLLQDISHVRITRVTGETEGIMSSLVHGNGEADNRLQLENGDFARKFGEVTAASTAWASDAEGKRFYVVNTALTLRQHIYYDWTKCQYVTQRR